MDIKAIVSRLLSASVAAFSVRVATKTGIEIDAATQASIVIGVYAGLHKVVEHLITKKPTVSSGSSASNSR